MPFKQVNPEEEKPEKEEIIICYNIRYKLEEKQLFIARYLYYTIVDWAFNISIIENSLLAYNIKVAINKRTTKRE